jgi:hypothetical protein
MMDNKGGRERAGLIEINHKGKILKTSVGSKTYEKGFSGVRANVGRYNKIGKIPLGYENRPDLIANLFFGTPASWWIICEKNNYFDVFEQMNVGDRVVIPTKR